MQIENNPMSNQFQFNYKQHSSQTITEHNLRKLFQLHDRLVEACEMANKCFSKQTVVYVTISFILGMFGIFFVIKEIFYDFSNESNLTHMACSYVLWSSQYGCVIVILLRVCEEARRLASETPLIVHKIVQRKPLFMLRHDIYYNKMKAFTLHSLHRKKTFQFSGQGMFSFDYTFIFSVSLHVVVCCCCCLLLFDAIIRYN